MASLTSVRYFAAVFFVLAQILATECTITKCDKINPCSCKSNEGVINLKPLDGTSTQASLQTTDVISQYQYFYNPCTDFSYVPASPQCQGVLGCQYSSNYGGSTIGTTKTVEFDVEDGTVKVKLSSAGDLGGRKMEVKLICDKSAKNPQFAFLQENPTSTYKFSLTSEHACPGASGGGGLSFGSVLCIILLVVVIVYAIGGYAFNTYKRGAEGAERIPNVAFWKELPSLVKDGFKFATSCGKSKAAYDEI